MKREKKNDCVKLVQGELIVANLAQIFKIHIRLLEKGKHICLKYLIFQNVGVQLYSSASVLLIHTTHNIYVSMV